MQEAVSQEHLWRSLGLLVNSSVLINTEVFFEGVIFAQRLKLNEEASHENIRRFNEKQNKLSFQQDTVGIPGHLTIWNYKNELAISQLLIFPTKYLQNKLVTLEKEMKGNLLQNCEKNPAYKTNNEFVMKGIINAPSPLCNLPYAARKTTTKKHASLPEKW